MAERNDPATFKQFKSSKSIIQFVDHPWFSYGETEPVKIEPQYPVGLLFLNKENSSAQVAYQAHRHIEVGVLGGPYLHTVLVLDHKAG